MHKQKLKLLFSLAAILVAAALLYFQMFPSPPPIEARPHLAVGEELAEQAVKIVGSGGRIVLIAPDVSVFQYPGAELQLKAFHRAIGKANLVITSTNLIKLDPNRLMRVQPGDFVEVLRKHSEADVVVSLLGPSIPTAEQKKRLPAKHARVVAICSGDMPRQVDMKALFEQHLLDVAIVSRPSPGLAAPQSDILREWFAHYFRVITSKNMADLPSHTDTAAR